jgi:hypothetical protein
LYLLFLKSNFSITDNRPQFNTIRAKVIFTVVRYLWSVVIFKLNTFKNTPTMDCLINYVGLRTAGQPVPESGLYINDLPGITIAQLGDLNNSDQATFLDLWAAIQRRASKIFTTTFTNAMSKKYRLKKITEAFKLSQTVDPTTNYPAAAELRGIYMDCFIDKSSFHHIPVSTVSVYLNSPVPSSFQLMIYEVHDDTLLLLDTFAIASPVAGWNSILVGKRYYDSRTLFICYDATAISSASIPLDSYDLNPYLYGDLAQFYSHIFINGAIYNNGSFSQSTDETYGLTATLGLQCSYDVLVCNYMQNMAVAWWYLLGSELMKERIYTDRVNRYTTVDLEKARELTLSLHNDYMNELLTFVDGIDLQRDWCIDCDAIVRQVEFLP